MKTIWSVSAIACLCLSAVLWSRSLHDWGLYALGLAVYARVAASQKEGT